MPEPALIPLDDATTPVACTISDAEIPERVALLERMRAAVTAVDRTPTGLLLHFPDDDAVRADLATFAVDEQRCCRFWGFAIVDGPAGVALRWDGPPSVAHLLDRFHTFFTTEASIGVLRGLL
jgi:hypothetical protein